MQKHVLLLAYEYPGYNSKQGAALSRRVKHVAESFEANGWTVTVLHKDQIGESGTRPFVTKNESPSVDRVSVRLDMEKSNVFERSFLRRLLTLYYLALRGDRSYKWVTRVKKSFADLRLKKPDLIISFFTPRAPVILGNHFSKQWNVPWAVDLQDEVDHGIHSTNRYFGAINSFVARMWMRNEVRSASMVIHVSPEWARRDSGMLKKDVTCIRHAVGNDEVRDETLYNDRANDVFEIFYGGSIDIDNQELGTLNDVLSNVRTAKPVKLVVAGSERTFMVFRSRINNNVNIEYTGWLKVDDYRQRILQAHCCLIIPWSGKGRQVIPSKFYEVCTLRPVWIVGNDTGAFRSLMNDCQHPVGNYNSIDFNTAALEKAVEGDYSLMFRYDKCGTPLTAETELCQRYLKLLNKHGQAYDKG